MKDYELQNRVRKAVTLFLEKHDYDILVFNWDYKMPITCYDNDTDEIVIIAVNWDDSKYPEEHITDSMIDDTFVRVMRNKSVIEKLTVYGAPIRIDSIGLFIVDDTRAGLKHHIGVKINGSNH